MSGQPTQGDLERRMDDAPDGERIDLQDIARAVNSGKVSAEEQPTPQDELREGNAYAKDQVTKGQENREGAR